MDYMRACEILGYRPGNTKKVNADFAKTRQSVMTSKAPLRFKVACGVLIEAAE